MPAGLCSSLGLAQEVTEGAKRSQMMDLWLRKPFPDVCCCQQHL